jgi:predicted nucleic acid-binding protein
VNGQVVVDASVWVSRLYLRDAHHSRSVSWFAAQTANTLLISPVIVLAEVASAVARRTGEPMMAMAMVARLRALPNLRLVAVDDPMGALAARLAAEQALRGADAVYVAAALSLGLPLVTLDQQQLERAQAVITVISPEENL